MRKFGHKNGFKNDLWDWGVILLVVVGMTIILWAGVWVANARGGAPQGAVTARSASLVVPPLPARDAGVRPKEGAGSNT